MRDTKYQHRPDHKYQVRSFEGRNRDGCKKTGDGRWSMETELTHKNLELLSAECKQGGDEGESV